MVILNQAVRSQLAKDERILTQNIVISSVRVYADASPAKSKFTQSLLHENIILLFIFSKSFYSHFFQKFLFAFLFVDEGGKVGNVRVSNSHHSRFAICKGVR